jgi:lipopolysaccharide transport system ATP-binding protein
MAPLIQFDHVSKRFALHRDRPRSFREMFVRLRRRHNPMVSDDPETLWALRDVSFTIDPGETVGLIGPNGAGKSTTFKLISRIFAPTSGRISVNGRVAALLELGMGFHPDLSGRDNVFLSGALIGMSRVEMKRKFDAIVAFSELEAFIDVPVKHYSSGMFARLAFAVSIHLEPEALLVDEVLAVGDQAFQQKCLDRIAELREAGVTICMVSHALDTIRMMCTRAIWFDHGRVRADGGTEAVVRHYLDQLASTEAQRLAAAQTNSGNSTHRWGTRRVEITRVYLTDGEGQERIIFETGEPLIINLDYYAPAPLPAPVFGLAIHRNDGLHLCGPNTGFGKAARPTVSGHGTVRYMVPHLTLLDGLYHISVAVVNQTDTETYDYHDRLYSFRVQNSGARAREHLGVLTLRGEWQPAAQTEALAPAGER